MGIRRISSLMYFRGRPALGMNSEVMSTRGGSLAFLIFSPPSSSSQFPSCKTGPVTSRTPAALWNGKPARRSGQTAAIYSQPDLSCQWGLTAISFLNLLGSPAVQLLQTVRLHSALAAFQRSEEDSVSHAFQITRPYIRNPFS